MNDKSQEYHKNPNVVEAREHFKAARHAVYQGMEEFLPKGYLASRRTARKEFLMGLRKLLDAAIERAEKRAE